MQWRVYLKGHRFDLETLARRACSDRTQVIADEEGYYLTSTRFGDQATSHKVREAAASLVRLLNGIFSVQSSGYQPVSVGSVVLIRDDGSQQTFLHASPAVVKVRAWGSVRARAIHADGTVVDPGFVGEAEFISAAMEDPELERALCLLGDGQLDWVSLYRIYEIVKAACGGGRRLRELGWATRSEIERFRRTANHPDAAGDGARHAVANTLPPPNPMSLDEARTWIKSLVHCWMADAGSANDWKQP